MEARLQELLEKEFLNGMELEELEEHEDVKKVECLGQSSLHLDMNWYDVVLKNGDNYDIYNKEIDAYEVELVQEAENSAIVYSSSYNERKIFYTLEQALKQSEIELHDPINKDLDYTHVVINLLKTSYGEYEYIDCLYNFKIA